MRLFIFLIIFCFALNLSAQGVHFSDNREIPMQLNPAFAGVIHNDYVHRFVLAHRRQGNAVLGRNEFETSYLSYDRKLGLCKLTNDMFIGIGVEVLHDQVGTNFGKNAQFFHRQEANLNTSLGIKLNDESYLIAGLRTGLLSRGLSDDNLSFDSQFDGRDFDEGLSTLENFSNVRLLYFDIGAGFIFRGALYDNGRKQPIKIKTYEVGMSFMHLNNREEKFLINSVVEDLAKEYRIHAKADLLIDNGFKMTPSLILYKYGALFGKGKEWQIRSSLEFSVLKNWMIAGGMRLSNFAERESNLDALVFTLKWKPYADINNKKDNLIIGLSFDRNISPHLAKATKGYGAFELFITKYLTGNKNEDPCCPWANTKNQAFY